MKGRKQGRLANVPPSVETARFWVQAQWQAAPSDEGPTELHHQPRPHFPTWGRIQNIRSKQKIQIVMDMGWKERPELSIYRKKMRYGSFICLRVGFFVSFFVCLLLFFGSSDFFIYISTVSVARQNSLISRNPPRPFP